MIEVVRNKLADYAHKAWSGWMDYLFKHGEMLEDGRFVIDADKVSRWGRQATTEYIDLPENMEIDRVYFTKDCRLESVWLRHPITGRKIKLTPAVADDVLFLEMMFGA